ncbi:MAG TPA: hypothetical protein VGA99_12690 [bacterium]
MWPLLKAEIQYNKWGLAIGYTIGGLFLIAGFIWDMGGVYGLMGSILITYFITIAVVGAEIDKEKRDRLQALIPVTLKQLSWSRLLFLVVFQIGMLLLLFIAYLVHHLGKDSWALWAILCYNGIILVIISPFAIYHDLGFFGTRRYRLFFFCCLLFVAAALTGLLTSGYSRALVSFGSAYSKNWGNALFYNGLSALLLYLCRVIFLRRKSYLA